MATGTALSVFRSEWRRRIGWMAGLALTVALGGGVAMGSFIIAHRTDRAYPEFVADANVAELSINPSISSQAMDARIRTLPGTESVHSSSLLFASVTQLSEGRVGDLSANEADAAFQVRGSTDGEYIDADRPVVSAGRLPTGQREVFVGDDARADLEHALGREVRLGDSVPMAFWWSGLDDQDNPPDPDLVIAPIGVEQLRVVGFGRLSDEVLPDELYARDRLVVSSDVARQYSCAFDIRPDLTAEESTLQRIIPHDCATEFIYYSLELGGSGADLTTVRTAYASLVDELDALLPPSIVGQHSYEFIAQVRADLDARVRQTTRPTVAALLVFGGVAALASLAVVSLLIARNMRRSEADHISLLAIGATSGQRALVAAITPAVGVIAGLVGATLVAALISPIGPLGVVRDVDPSPGLSLTPAVMGPALAVALLALLAMIASVSIVGARRTSATPRVATPSLWRARLLDHGNSASLTTGLRATLGPTGSAATIAALVGAVVALAAVTSAAIFGANLSTLVTQPDRYGWPWQAAVITNAGFGFTDTDAVDATLGGDADVTSHTVYGFDSVQVDGHPVPAVYGLEPGDRFDFPIIDGRAPRVAGEAAIGAATADKFGIHVGDRVAIETPFYEPESVTIVGTAVLPSLGTFVADRTGLGTGIFVMPAAASTGIFPYPATFTGISLRSGVDAGDVVRRLGPDIAAFDIGSGQPVLTFSDPVRPPEIVNVGDMRTAPLVLGGLLALSLAAGLALSTAVSVRERRRELAVLRTLGCTGRALFTSVWWQVVAMVTIGLIGGLPLGVVAGRYAWGTFADELGVVPRADVSLVLLGAIVGGAALVAIVAALRPARTASAISPGQVLRSGL